MAARIPTGLTTMEASPMPPREELRTFGLTMGAAVALAFGILVPWFRDATLPAWPWIVAATLVALALALPAVLKPLYAAWMRIGHVLNWLISRATLVVVYYVVVVPMGLTMRLFKKDPLRLRFDKDVQTYRLPSSAPDRNHLERPF